MNLLRNRLPSRKDSLLAFTLCVIPNHVWSIFYTLNDIPAWILKMSNWELVGTISYIQTMALVESVVFILGLFTLAVILPARLFRDHFLSVSAIIVFLVSGGAVFLQNTVWIWKYIGTGAILTVVLFAVLYFIVKRFDKVGIGIRIVSQRLIVLAAFYILIDLGSLIIVVIRNI